MSKDWKLIILILSFIITVLILVYAMYKYSREAIYYKELFEAKTMQYNELLNDYDKMHKKNLEVYLECRSQIKQINKMLFLQDILPNGNDIKGAKP